MIRAWRVAAVLATALLTVLAVSLMVVRLVTTQAYGEFAGDFQVHLAVARQFLDTGQLYAPVQLAGPYTPATIYTASGVVNLYPPPAVLLFLPFLVLPAVLWWAIPLAITGWIVAYWRPAWWAWPWLLLPLVATFTLHDVATGNTLLWAVAAVALATRWPALGATLALKPSMLLVAPLFVRRRSWWAGLAVVGLVSLAFLPWWPQYLTATRNLAGGMGPLGSLAYNLDDVPTLLIPVLAWAARTRWTTYVDHVRVAGTGRRWPSWPALATRNRVQAGDGTGDGAQAGTGHADGSRVPFRNTKMGAGEGRRRAGPRQMDHVTG